MELFVAFWEHPAIKQLRGALIHLKRDIAANLMGWMLPEQLLYSVKTSYEIKELDQKFKMAIF